MSRGRPPRRVRFQPAVNMMNVVINRASRLTPAELERVLRTAHRSLKALREGVATELQWSVLASCVEFALSIERKGVVRGLNGHFKAAESALANIRRRAMEDGAWRATALYYQELDDITEAMRLHTFQLEQLSSSELARAVEAAKTRVHQAGGTVIDVRDVREELAA